MESWDLLAQFETGHFLFARFLLTNLGPGDHNAVVLGHLVTPAGERVRFRNGRRRDQWELSDDGRALDVNKCHLDLRGGVARLRVEKAAVQLELTFTLRDGTGSPPGLLPTGYFSETLAANAPVEGEATLRGAATPIALRGTGAVLHTWSAEPEADLFVRRTDFFTLTQGRGVQLTELRSPDGAVQRWLRTTGRRSPGHETTTLALRHVGSLAALPTDFPVEDRWTLASGPVQGEITLREVLHQQDPLAAIPGPLRTLIGWTLTMEPHQAWAAADYDLTIDAEPGDEPEALRGAGVAVIAFTRAP